MRGNLHGRERQSSQIRKLQFASRIPIVGRAIRQSAIENRQSSTTTTLTPGPLPEGEGVAGLRRFVRRRRWRPRWAGWLSMSRSTILSVVKPSASALKLVTMRWRSTGLGHGLDVLGGDVVAAVQHRAGLAAQDEVLAGPRAGAPGHVVADEVRARRASVGRASPAPAAWRSWITWSADRHAADDAPGAPGSSGPSSTGCRLHLLDGRGQADDVELLVPRGVLHEDLEHEAVLLGLGQRVGAFLLDGVLRGQHEERVHHRACACRRR